MTGSLRDASSQRVVVPRIVRATGFVAKTLGLLGREAIDDGEGMWFDAAFAIHTLGMRFPIDAVFLDGNGRVLKIAADVKPNRLWIAARGGRSIVELRGGAAAQNGIVEGMHLEIQWNGET